MTVNKVTNTPMIPKSYNCRGLTVNHSVTKNCVRQSDGTLWAVVGDYSNKVQIIRSSNNGFSWEVVHSSVESGTNMRELDGLNADGLFAYLIIDERWRLLDLYMGEWEPIGGDGSVERSRFDLDDDTVSETNTTVLSTTDTPFHAMFDISYNHEQAFLFWVTAGGQLKGTRCSPRTTSVSSDLTLGTPASGLFAHLSSCCTENGKVYIAFGWLDGSDRKISFVEYDSTTPSFGTAVLIENLGVSPAIAKDIAIARDGLGTLCVVYYDQGDTEVRYATSIDNGATWDVNTLTMTSGHATYTDTTTGDNAGRTNIIGGSKGGFLLTYVEDNSSGTPRAYIRQLTTSDSGATYDLQAEKEIGTNAPWNDQPITGVQFFHPPAAKLLDISDPGQVRIAFTVGEGDSLLMGDTVPVTFAQELLEETAYSSQLTSEASSYTLDTADSISLRFRFNLLAGADSNIDYHAAGFTGQFTDRYAAAFTRVGTQMRFLRYEPDADNFMNDRSAYNAPTETESLAIFDPQSYSFPTPQIASTEFVSWVEQDVRKIYLPPNKHLARTFLVNDGGHLKRTVWLCEFDGNRYEISQVVPRFLSNQICYYEANAYVVGPSRDPFSRTVLPSET